MFSISAFGISSLICSLCETKETKVNDTYTIKVIDNEIVFNNVVVYRFIPVDGGFMDFTFNTDSITISESETNIEDKETLYLTERKEISSFIIGETPVTVKLWDIVMEDTLSKAVDKVLDTYINNKTYEEWNSFVNKLEEKTGRKFSLPTSFQWEYAARGGQESKNYLYSGSNDICEVANYKDNYKFKTFIMGKCKKPNELGIYDMSGSVWELTSTKLSDLNLDIYKDMIEENIDNSFISRGGDINSDAEECETKIVKHRILSKTGARLIIIL